jgi:putative tryptophan/tyrosine transport system substrate-binding protein
VHASTAGNYGTTDKDPSANARTLQCTNGFTATRVTSDSLAAPAQIGGIRVRRREFISLISAVAASPIAAHAQLLAKNPAVGVLHPGQAETMPQRLTAVREGLSRSEDKGNQAIDLVIRLADGNLSRLPALATELVEARVDAILAAGPPAVKAARGATATIPIIAIDLETDPVASALITSLGRPGGNVTGVFLDLPDFSAKCLQILVESVPALPAIGVLWDPTTGSLQLEAVQAAASRYGIRVQVLEARRIADIAEAFNVIDRSRLPGIVVLSSPLFGGNPQILADLAVRRRLPTISVFPDVAREGGLLSYGPEIQDLYRQAADMARKVIRGAAVAETPVERPTRYLLIVNVKTAKIFGITLPPSVLLRADEVIE